MRTSDTDRKEPGWAPLTLICSVCARAHATAFGEHDRAAFAIGRSNSLVGNRLADGTGAVDCVMRLRQPKRSTAESVREMADRRAELCVNQVVCAAAMRLG